MAQETIDPALAGTGPDQGGPRYDPRAFGAPVRIQDGADRRRPRLHLSGNLMSCVTGQAGGLHALGVRPGDRVSLYAPNRWEWVVAYHATLRLGAVVNPVNVMLTPEEVAFVLNDCGAAVIFTSGAKAEVIVGLTRTVPTLRRVVSFDSASAGTTSFEELLSLARRAPEVAEAGADRPVDHRLHVRHDRPSQGGDAVAQSRLPQHGGVVRRPDQDPA